MKAIFLDRDGTLNPDTGYLNHPDQFDLYPGVAHALLKAQNAGFALVLVSNQSGVGRGLITMEQIQSIHSKLDRLLADVGVKISLYSLCFHRPDENCACRKPSPKLILDAAQQLKIDVTQSYMVGDRMSDLGCGLNAKVKKVFLVKTGDGQKEFEKNKNEIKFPAFVVENLQQAIDQILKD